MISSIFKKVGKAVSSAATVAIKDFKRFEEGIKNAQNLENSRFDLMNMGVSSDDTNEIIENCKNYSYTLPIPNSEGFQKRFNLIRLKLLSGEKWETIKKVLNE